MLHEQRLELDSASVLESEPQVVLLSNMPLRFHGRNLNRTIYFQSLCLNYQKKFLNNIDLKLNYTDRSQDWPSEAEEVSQM